MYNNWLIYIRSKILVADSFIYFLSYQISSKMFIILFFKDIYLKDLYFQDRQNLTLKKKLYILYLITKLVIEIEI